MSAAAALIGWDVGGAHLKGAAMDARGQLLAVVQVPCALWLGLDHLDRALAQARAVLGDAPTHAITMTGELVDAFANRRVGVAAIAARLAERMPARRLVYFGGPAGWIDAEHVAAEAGAVASANWYATAAWVASRVGAGLLVDIGSTTTDIVPLADGRVAARGRNDAERLASGELVYTGVVRTPVIALAATVPFAGAQVPLIPEWFATSADVHRLCGGLDERHDQHATADDGPKTIAASARRLARMTGRDLEDAPFDDWTSLARHLRENQLGAILQGCAAVLSATRLDPLASVITAGAGAFLARDVASRLKRPAVDFAGLVGADGVDRDAVGVCAPAVAAGLLAYARAAGAGR